jgi:hypothetical protein
MRKLALATACFIPLAYGCVTAAVNDVGAVCTDVQGILALPKSQAKGTDKIAAAADTLARGVTKYCGKAAAIAGTPQGQIAIHVLDTAASLLLAEGVAL